MDDKDFEIKVLNTEHWPEAWHFRMESLCANKDVRDAEKSIEVFHRYLDYLEGGDSDGAAALLKAHLNEDPKKTLHELLAAWGRGIMASQMLHDRIEIERKLVQELNRLKAPQMANLPKEMIN